MLERNSTLYNHSGRSNMGGGTGTGVLLCTILIINAGRIHMYVCWGDVIGRSGTSFHLCKAS